MISIDATQSQFNQLQTGDKAPHRGGPQNCPGSEKKPGETRTIKTTGAVHQSQRNQLGLGAYQSLLSLSIKRDQGVLHSADLLT